MSIGTVTVKVYCNGGYHEPEELRFHERATKTEIRDELKRRNWVVKPGGSTYCPRHQTRGSIAR
ncbi:hypothetical protein SEA_FIZZLES_57 [Microbacterium phage Fizzles]|nr:hypothetical protein SEA_FIZZLES_57 [Microbacterium phage Fizzles]